jgi:hypothetical protein
MTRCACGQLIRTPDGSVGGLCNECFEEWLEAASARTAETNRLHPVEG